MASDPLLFARTSRGLRPSTHRFADFPFRSRRFLPISDPTRAPALASAPSAAPAPFSAPFFAGRLSPSVDTRRFFCGRAVPDSDASGASVLTRLGSASFDAVPADCLLDLPSWKEEQGIRSAPQVESRQ